MNYIDSLKNVIKKLHGCDSDYLESVPVHEVFNGKTVWDGTVEVFSIKDHPKAKKCYAWAYDENGKGKQFVAVLELPPVESPKTAVQAAIVSGSKK